MSQLQLCLREQERERCRTHIEITLRRKLGKNFALLLLPGYNDVNLIV